MKTINIPAPRIVDRGPTMGRSTVLAQKIVHKPAVTMPPGYFGALPLPERAYVLTIVKTEIVPGTVGGAQ